MPIPVLTPIVVDTDYPHVRIPQLRLHLGPRTGSLYLELVAYRKWVVAGAEVCEDGPYPCCSRKRSFRLFKRGSQWVTNPAPAGPGNAAASTLVSGLVVAAQNYAGAKGLPVPAELRIEASSSLSTGGVMQAALAVDGLLNSQDLWSDMATDAGLAAVVIAVFGLVGGYNAAEKVL